MNFRAYEVFEQTNETDEAAQLPASELACPQGAVDTFQPSGAAGLREVTGKASR